MLSGYHGIKEKIPLSFLPSTQALGFESGKSRHLKCLPGKVMVVTLKSVALLRWGRNSGHHLSPQNVTGDIQPWAVAGSNGTTKISMCLESSGSHPDHEALQVLGPPVLTV